MRLCKLSHIRLLVTITSCRFETILKLQGNSALKKLTKQFLGKILLFMHIIYTYAQDTNNKENNN